ncbi:transposase family protein [Streptomyces sp. NBC_00322]|nr:transposase family protein [Streptomyces sp. NBC_00322]
MPEGEAGDRWFRGEPNLASRLLTAHRRHLGTPRRSRVPGPFRQAVLVLRWFRERGCVHCLARDAGISQATGQGPVRRPKGQSEQALHADARATNALIRNVRTLGERTAAELKQRWRTLHHVTLSPSRIGDITRAALVLNRHWK